MDVAADQAHPAGFFTRADALDSGLDDRDISAALRSGEWSRIRRGAYTQAGHWLSLDEVGRHRVRARAVLRALGSGVVLSHVSAALEHGLAVWGVPLDVVHVTRLDGRSGGGGGDVVHHVGRVHASEVLWRDGVPVVDATRAAVETGLVASAEAALVTFDSLLRSGHCDHDGLRRQFEAVARWPGSRHLHVPVRMADPCAESPGESRGRWLFQRGGLPAPITQFRVVDAHGTLLGQCDWGWPGQSLLGEFDGRAKYGRLLRPGQDPGDAVFAEKQREDRIREATGHSMIRLVWDDLGRPRSTVRRIARMMRNAA